MGKLHQSSWQYSMIKVLILPKQFYFFSEMNGTPWHFEFIWYYSALFFLHCSLGKLCLGLEFGRIFPTQHFNKNNLKLRNAGMQTSNLEGSHKINAETQSVTNKDMLCLCVSVKLAVCSKWVGNQSQRERDCFISKTQHHDWFPLIQRTQASQQSSTPRNTPSPAATQTSTH